MSHYREMVLLSLEDYKQLRKQITYVNEPGYSQDLYTLREKTEHLPSDHRLKLESEVLRQHMKQPDAPAPTAASMESFNDDVILDSLNRFPHLNRQRAIGIYHHLKSFKRQWTERGQMMNESNEPIPQSNIIELIDYISGSKNFRYIPAGFKEFSHLIEQAQLPRSYLSSKGLTRVDDYKQLETNDVDDEDVKAWETIKQPSQSKKRKLSE